MDIYINLFRCGNAATSVASSQSASRLQATGDARIFVMLAPNWLSSMYRNQQAGLPPPALLHCVERSFEICHSLIGRLHNYVKQEQCREYTYFANVFTAILHIALHFILIQVYCSYPKKDTRYNCKNCEGSLHFTTWKII